MSQAINFTRASIEKLPLPQDGRVVYRDLKTKGFEVWVSSHGTKVFYFLRKLRGTQKLIRIKIGGFPEMSVEEAKRQASLYNLEVEKGNNPLQSIQDYKAEPFFSELFNDYIERHSKVHKKTWKEDLTNYRLYLEELGKKKLSEIVKKDIALIHNGITKKGHPRTANKVLALLSSVFNWAISTGLFNDNPVKGIKKNREVSRDRFLGQVDTTEMQRFFDAVLAESNKTIRDYILISLFSGARRSNILSMRWSDLDLERGLWYIKITKNGTPQTVTLCPEAISILTERKKDINSFFVFPGTGQSGHLKEPRKGWKRILKRAGIEDLRIHDLRRSFGSWQAITGASPLIIGKSLNHKNIQSTAIYSRLNIDPVRLLVNNAVAAMMKIANKDINEIISK